MRPSLIVSPLSLLLAALQIMPSFELYFYIDGVTPKCFFEELPKDTLVVGRSCNIFHWVNRNGTLHCTGVEKEKGLA